MIPRLVTVRDQAETQLDESRAHLEGCFVDIDFGLDDSAINSFAALRRAFDALRSCEKIWDITGTAQTNRIVERTIAATRISRSVVQFDFASSDIIRSKYQAMRFGNVTGLDVHIYPGFIMTRDKGSDFALIELHELDLRLSQSHFIEEEGVPSDSEVVGHTWRKANKDGSPDKRFNGNYQIPIAMYGEIWFRSPTGLLEAYMLSNYAKTAAFSAAMTGHKKGNCSRFCWQHLGIES
jgi:hypothetical protein